MQKILYIIRHCQAEGQEPTAELTAIGRQQAEILANFLQSAHIERILSSPFTRAVQSIEPLAQRLGIEIEVDARLIERVLSSEPLPNWREGLQATFSNPDLYFYGGESSRTATERALAVVQELADDHRTTAFVSHGNLSTLLLKAFNHRIGFETWERMTNPDVFRVVISEAKTYVEHIWPSI
jgi:2,3-bisphosphoglycerate-dependent phosphoglycerate mutase